MNPNLKVVLITGRWSTQNRAISKTASKLVNILSPMSKYIHVVSANHKVEVDDSKVFSTKIDVNDVNASFLTSLFLSIFYQVKVLIIMMKLLIIKKIANSFNCIR